MNQLTQWYPTILNPIQDAYLYDAYSKFQYLTVT